MEAIGRRDAHEKIRASARGPETTRTRPFQRADSVSQMCQLNLAATPQKIASSVEQTPARCLTRGNYFHSRDNGFTRPERWTDHKNGDLGSSCLRSPDKIRTLNPPVFHARRPTPFVMRKPVEGGQALSKTPRNPRAILRSFCSTPLEDTYVFRPAGSRGSRSQFKSRTPLLEAPHILTQNAGHRLVHHTHQPRTYLLGCLLVLVTLARQAHAHPGGHVAHTLGEEELVELSVHAHVAVASQ